MSQQQLKEPMPFFEIRRFKRSPAFITTIGPTPGKNDILLGAQRFTSCWLHFCASQTAGITIQAMSFQTAAAPAGNSFVITPARCHLLLLLLAQFFRSVQLLRRIVALDRRRR